MRCPSAVCACVCTHFYPGHGYRLAFCMPSTLHYGDEKNTIVPSASQLSADVPTRSRCEGRSLSICCEPLGLLFEVLNAAAISPSEYRSGQ